MDYNFYKSICQGGDFLSIYFLKNNLEKVLTPRRAHFGLGGAGGNGTPLTTHNTATFGWKR
jgi:hypothetical protein